MSHYDIDALKFNDVMLVEMHVSHYRIKEDSSQSSKHGKAVTQVWNNYKVTFHLQSISLLYAAPYVQQAILMQKSMGIVI